MCLRQCCMLPLIVLQTSYWSLQCKRWLTELPVSEGHLSRRWVQHLSWMRELPHRVPSFCYCSKGDLLAVFQCPWEVSSNLVPREAAELQTCCDFQAKGGSLRLCYSQVSRAGGRQALWPGLRYGNWELLQPKWEGAVLAIWVKASQKCPMGHTCTQESCLCMHLPV